MIIKESY